VICFTVASAFAQIQDLAATADGSQLYFATPYRQVGTDQFNSSKIFRYANGEFSLVAQIQQMVQQPDGTRVRHDFHLPNLTADGAVVVWEDQTVQCAAGSQPCPDPGKVPLISTSPLAIGVQLPDALKPGSVRVSGNGRYFLGFCNCGSLVAPLLFDLATGTLTTIAEYRAIEQGIQAVADDGTLLLRVRTNNQIVTWKNGVVRELPLRNQNNYTPRLSRDASMFVYQSADNVTGNAILVAHDLNSGADVVLAVGPPAVTVVGQFPTGLQFIGPYFVPSISDDGRRVLFMSRDSNAVLQAFVSGTDGAGLMQLTTEASGTAGLTLSGDGHIAYVVTSRGALLRIDIESGETTTLVPQMPKLSNVFPSNTAVPGSQILINGLGLAAADGRSMVSIQGVAAPVVSTSPQQVKLQIPWEYDPRNPLKLIVSGVQSPFELAAPLQAAAAFPAILDVWNANYTNDLSVPAKPAKVGDIIVFDLLGLGPVSPQPATGAPAPIDKLSYAQSSVSCDFSGAGQSLGSGEILFAGLTPTLVGSYQINVRTPASIPNDLQNVGVTCSVQTSAGIATSQPVYFYLSR
jgi:uncharacterized protein (TIGR03437 family)